MIDTSRIINKIRHSANHFKFAHYLRTSTNFRYIGTPGKEIEEIFKKISQIPGWFNLDDCSHFLIVLRLQSNFGMKGDLLEIGSYHGRSAAVMASTLSVGEKICVCDAFQHATDDLYADKPTPDRLIYNIQSLSPNIAPDRIEVHNCLSNNLKLGNDRYFRFIHIDGGHSEDQALFDLELSANHLMDNGTIVMDDYGNPDWPGVTRGTDRFLAKDANFEILADLNRHGAQGRKLYIIKKA